MESVGYYWFEIWTESLLRAFAYVVGVEQLKLFTSKSAEAMMMLIEEKNVAPTAQGSNIPQIVSSTEQTIRALQPGKLDWIVETQGDTVKLSIGSCPFAQLCSSMISEIITSGRVDKAKLPCLMSELAVGACRTKNIKSRSVMIQFAPGMKCVTQIGTMEV